MNSYTRLPTALLWALCFAVAVPACGMPTPDTAASRHSQTPHSAPPSGSATTSSTSSSPPRPLSPGATNRVTADAWEVIGSSAQGKPIRSRTVGQGPRKVLFIGGIHGDESEGAYTTAVLPEAFINAGLADRVTLTIVEDANPDGRASGTRGNANGVDINRNFPASNFDGSDPTRGGTPLSQPESRALFDVIQRVDPVLIVAMHSWSGRQFINFDGPARDIAERFAQTSGLPVEESSTFAPTPGSLGSFVGRDGGKPLLTVEVLKGADPVAVWNQLSTALLQAIGGDV